MAEGWSRVTGEPGRLRRNPGPGLTQLGTALTVAVRAHIPLVVFAGDTALDDQGSVQNMDQQRFVEATGAAFVPIWTGKNAEDAVRQAFYSARLESRPVVLNAPMDIQQETYDGDIEDVPALDHADAGRASGSSRTPTSSRRRSGCIAEQSQTGDRERTGRGKGRRPARR